MTELKVLFVEDSPTMRRIIMNALQNIGFSDIIEAEHGVDALEKLNGEEVGLVLTDWNMPEMNGEELVGALRSNPKYKTIPIIMITTRGMKEDVMNAVKLGVNGYIVKPFTPDILKRKLESILN